MNMQFSRVDLQFFDVYAVYTEWMSEYGIFQNKCTIFHNFLLIIKWGLGDRSFIGYNIVTKGVRIFLSEY